MPEIAGIRNHFISSNILLFWQDIFKIELCTAFPQNISIAKAVPAMKKPHHNETILKFL